MKKKKIYPNSQFAQRICNHVYSFGVEKIQIIKIGKILHILIIKYLRVNLRT